MNKFKKLICIVGLLILFILSFCAFIIYNHSLPDVDTVEINKIINECYNSIDNLHELDKLNFNYDFTILDCSEHVLYSKGKSQYTTLEYAVKKHNLYFVLEKGSKKLGTVVIFTNVNKDVYTLKNKINKILFISFGLIIITLILYFYYLYKNILHPFNMLQGFAHQISTGNLDAPLFMDKNNIFGMFTESFDIMREELHKTKEKEYLANKSKKELIASLSHDIKTPVTSIKLISELLLVMVKEDKIKNKISSIYTKADEIDHLVTDMFSSTLEELHELKVNTVDEYSSSLEEIFRNADYYNKAVLGKIPECAIKIDLMRFQQVINNIITNSYKYADTPIDVEFILEQYNLKITIKDYGQGVDCNELPLIFNKFYRGKNPYVQKHNGSGLGLYISKYLMNEMGGDILCFNEPDGFKVELIIQLL